MSAPVLVVKNVAKQYKLHQGPATSTFVDVFRNLLRRNKNGATKSDPTEFFALRDVSFNVDKGEVVGLIGKNGAGKSTLLKILSRIVYPTTGSFEVEGRIGSLLEVGTGFHPELTGGENIYLNGAILGMSRADIKRRFDEIVAFSGVERFIQTPVKHYSSGMYTRLAFAVAVHLEPEILLVDEVLAVGDAEFQRKCFAKMNEVSKGGKTVLFVSHNMAAMRQICTRGIMLDAGKIVADGPIDNVIDEYLGAALHRAHSKDVQQTSLFEVLAVDITQNGKPAIKTFEPLELSVRLRAKRRIEDPGLYVGFLTLNHERVAGLDLKDLVSSEPLEIGDELTVTYRIDHIDLLPGSYWLELHVKDMAHHAIERVPDLFGFDILETPVYGGRKLDHWFGHVGLRVTPTLNVVKTTRPAKEQI